MIKISNNDKSGFANNIGSLNGRNSISLVEPVTKIKNDTWLDLNTNLRYRYDGTKWILMGGNCIILTAGENLSQGHFVYISQSDGKIYKNPVGGYMGIGFVFADATTNNDVYIVTSGLCYVLPVVGTSLSYGYVMKVSSSPATAGYVADQNSISGLNYAYALGHVVENSSSAGALTLAIYQPN